MQMNSATITLKVVQGNLLGQEFLFHDPGQCLIGRMEDCDIQVTRDQGFTDISRHHCLLDIDPPTLKVRDLGSLNGTFVNGEIIGQRPHHYLLEDADLDQFEPRELHDGDEVMVGSTIFRVGIVASRDTPFPMMFV
jgi:pSer/pThr/pTyr-binding forkhead associated (FHA) protein